MGICPSVESAIMTSSPDFRTFSRLGQRATFGQALFAAAPSFPNLYALSADLGNSSGLDRFKQRFPDQYLNVGIAEQNMIGFASGLSTLGFNFCYQFAPFLTMRACEQVREFIHMRSNVKLVAIGSGVSMGYLGNSHLALRTFHYSSMLVFPSISPPTALNFIKWFNI